MKRDSILSGASYERLHSLLAERAQCSTEEEKRTIEKRIHDLFSEEWCVMFTDLEGFSKKSDTYGIIHFLQVILRSEEIAASIIEEHDGILLKSEWDSLLVVFRNPEKALLCGIRMIQRYDEENRKLPKDEHIDMGIGLGFGEILKIGDTDVFWEEVNRSSKLGEDSAESNEILLTTNMYEKLCAMSGRKDTKCRSFQLDWVNIHVSKLRRKREKKWIKDSYIIVVPEDITPSDGCKK